MKYYSLFCIAILSLLLMSVKGDRDTGQIFSLLPDMYFISERPTYLSTATNVVNTTGMCGLANTSNAYDTYCNLTTLTNIQTVLQGFSSNVTSKVNSSIGLLRDSFSNLGDLLWRRLGASQTSLAGLKIVFEKILMNYRIQQTGVGREMVRCMNTVTKVLAGLLCAGCNSTKNPNVIKPPVQPIIHLKNTTVQAIERDCVNFLKLVQGSVDSYHRTKMYVVDYLTAELGAQNHLCTCNGTQVNYTDMLNYNASRTLTSITTTGWTPFLTPPPTTFSDIITLANTFTPPMDNPYFTNNSMTLSQDTSSETYANSTISNSFLFSYKGGAYKTFKTDYLSNVTKLAFAIGRVFNRTITKRSFASAYRELDEMRDMYMFTFDEVRVMALNLKKSFDQIKSDNNQLGIIYKLMTKLLIDFLLNPAPSANYIGFAFPNMTANITYSYGLALYNFAKGFNFANKLLSVSGCSLPYINSGSTTLPGMMATYYCGGTCNFDTLAMCETSLIQTYTSTAIIMPLFSILSRTTQAIPIIDANVTDFMDTYEDISLTSQNFRDYIMMKYFPPYYYRVNSADRKYGVKNADAVTADSDYQNNVLKIFQDWYADCQSYAIQSTVTVALFTELMRAERDLARSDKLIRQYSLELESTDFSTFVSYELNKRAAMKLMMCTTSSSCGVGYVGDDLKLVGLQLPTMTTLNPEYALMDARLANGYLGMASVHELANYSDEENLALSRCARLFSARTSLCVEPVEDNVLQLPTLEFPPDYSALRGAELAALVFTRHKLLGLLDFAYNLQDAVSDITQGKDQNTVPNDPIVVIDDINGLDLLVDTGMVYGVNSTGIDLDLDLALIIPPEYQASSAIRLYFSIPLLLIFLLF